MLGSRIVDAVLIIAATAAVCLLVGLAVVWTWRELKPVWDAEREHKALHDQLRNRHRP